MCPLGRGLVPIVATICLTSFLYNMGQATFDAFFAVLAKSRFSLVAADIGLMLTGLAGTSFLVSALAFAPLQRALGITTTCIIGLALVSAGAWRGSVT